MKKKKFKIAQLIVPILFCLIVGIIALVLILMPEEAEEVASANVYAYVDGEKEYVLENEELKFVLDAATTRFSVTKKSNGYVWNSNPEDVDSDPIALTADKNNLKSTAIITYMTGNGVTTPYNNFAYSVEKGIYEIEAGNDYIKVNYSIGETEKEFMIPLITTEEKMTNLMSRMGESEVKQVKEYYRLYDINNLKKSDDKEALLAQYPSLADQKMYIIRDNIKDYIKEKIQGYFETAGYTNEEYQEDLKLANKESTSDKPVFNLSIVYRLDGDDLVAEVPFEDITYNEKYPMTTINLLPYFGASGTDEEGFLFVPEGGGAIIRYNNGKVSQNSYYSNVFGWDYAKSRDSLVHETKSAFGVFGMADTKASASFLCMLEKGASYAGITADISGKNFSYNYVNATYTVVHSEAYDVSAKSNEPVYIFEEGLPDESIVQRYEFLDSTDYADMAGAYRNYLFADATPDDLDDKASTPVVAEIVGAVDKVQQVMGFPKSVPLPLTTYEEALDIIKELSEAGIPNLSIKMSGWANDGVSQSVLNHVKTISKLGSKKELQNVITYAKENRMDLYLNGIVDFAYRSNVWDGFMAFRDAAKFVSDEKAELYGFSLVDYREATWNDSYYLLNAKNRMRMIANLASAISSYEASGISFEDEGNLLSADYNPDDRMTREEAITLLTDSLTNIKEDGQKVMINSGNSYAAPYADIIVDMDLEGTNYTILDEQIPFYQIALHGYVPYTAEAINTASDYQNVLLKSAETGAGLYFVFMKEQAITLQETLYTKYYGADFDAWYDRAISIYRDYEEKLGYLANQKITGYERVDAQVTKTVYEDGSEVYVNYGYEDYEADGVTVKARDYNVKKGD